MERRKEVGVDLKKWLTASQHHNPLLTTGSPKVFNYLRERSPTNEAPTALTIDPDEIRVTEIASCRRAIALSAAPQVAAGKTAEDRRSPGMTAFALQRVEDFLDRVGHRFHAACAV